MILLCIPAFVYAASCDSEGAGYYVKFTLDGTEYACYFGHPNINIDVPYAAVTTGIVAQANGDEFIEFYGGNIETGTDPETLDLIVEVEGFLYVETAGTYTGNYSLDDTFNSVLVWIYSDATWYLYTTTLGTVTIDTFNDIGGRVEGSFDATFVFGGDLIVPAALGDSPQTVTGTFRVKRVSEEDFPEPVIN